MKRIYSILAVIIVSTMTLLTSCSESGKTATSSNPIYNALVDRFSTGMIGRNDHITIELTEALPVNANIGKYAKITPSRGGQWSLDSLRTKLTFTPIHPLERGQQYTIELNLKKLYPDNAGAENFKFSVRTLPAAATAKLGLIRCTDSTSTRYSIEGMLTTADTEDSTLIHKLAQWSEPLNVSWNHSSDGRHHRFTINNIAANDKQRAVTLNMQNASLGYKDAQSLEIAIPAKGEFSLLSSEMSQSGDNSLELCFSQILDPYQDLNGLITVEGREVSLARNGNIVRLYFEPDSEKSADLTIASALRSSSGKSLGETIYRTETIERNTPAVRFVGKSTIVPAAEDSPVVVNFEARDLRAVTLIVMRTPERNIGQFLQQNTLSEPGNLILTAQPVACTTIFLDQHSTLNLDRWATYAIDLQKIVKLEPGALYSLSLEFDRSCANIECISEQERITPLVAAQADRERMATMEQQFDMGGFYWSSNMDWENYNWRTRDDPCSQSYYFNCSATRNLLVTDLGVIAKSGQREGAKSRFNSYNFTVSSITTTKPVRNAFVDLYTFQGAKVASGSTAKDGTLTLEWEGSAPYYAIVSDSRQRTYLLLSSASELSSSTFDVSGETLQSGLRAFIYAERGVWRPGDTIHLNMVLNRPYFIPADHPVTVELRSPLGQLYQQRTAPRPVGPIYSFTLNTDSNAPTGVWSATVKAGGAQFSKRLRIESIKPNRLSINLNFPYGDSLLQRGNPINATLSSRWLTGTVAADMKYAIDIELTPSGSILSRITPRGAKKAPYSNFTFDNPYNNTEAQTLTTITGRLNDNGEATINTPVGESQEPETGMMLATLTTRVFEPSGESSIDVSSMYYSPFESYVGINNPEPDRQLSTDHNYDFRFASVTAKAAPIAGRQIEVTIYRLDWHWWWGSNDRNSLARYISDNMLSPVSTQTITTGKDGMATLPVNITKHQWGTYYISARDMSSGHTSAMLTYFDSPGYSRSGEGSDPTAAMRLGVSLDKESYAVGEQATVRFPATEGSRAILSIENGTRVLHTTAIDCKPKDGMSRISFDIRADMQPNAYAYVTLLQPYGSVQNDLPVRLYGIAPIKVSSPTSHLNPTIKCPDQILPESELTIIVGEKNSRAMSYTLAIVDEGLLGLTRFHTPNPWDAFNARVALGVRTWDIYNNILGAYGGRIEQMFAIGGDDALVNGAKNSARRFPPMVKYLGTFNLARGKSATHKVKLPAYMGSVRVMVVAAESESWGSASKSTVVKAPLMVLGTAPRVVAPGDVIDIPATILSSEDGPGNVNVSIKSGNRFQIVGKATQQLNIKGKGEQVAYFRLKVLDTGNTSDIELTATRTTGGAYTSNYKMQLPVRNINTPVNDGQSRTLAAGQSVTINQNTNSAVGPISLSLEISALPSMSLARRMEYLSSYPYGCIEQIVSGAFPLLYIPKIDNLTTQQLTAMRSKVERVLGMLKNYSTADGGMGYWMGDATVNTWGTIYALHFMTAAMHAGYEIPTELYSRLKGYTVDLTRRWDTRTNPSQNLVDAYGLYVLALAGDPAMGAMNRLRQDPSLLSSDARDMLAAAYAAAQRADIGRTILAAPASTVNDQTNYGSTLRSQAMKLIAATAIADNTNADQLARSVAQSLSSPEWLSTQSTAWALLAIADYTKLNPKSGTLSFEWSVGPTTPGSKTKELKGHVAKIEKPMWNTQCSPIADKSKITVKNMSQGTLYINTVASFMATANSVAAASNGVSVKVEYVDSKGAALDVNNLTRGTDFTARVSITNRHSNELKDLMINHPIPSGWEIVNSSSGALPEGVTYQDRRDAAIYSYIPTLELGETITINTYLTATYSGVYTLPAVHCSPMYDGTISGNSASSTIEVNQ